MEKAQKIDPNLALSSQNRPNLGQPEVEIYGVSCLFGPTTIARNQNMKNSAFHWQRWPKKDLILLLAGLKRPILLKSSTFLV